MTTFYLFACLFMSLHRGLGLMQAGNYNFHLKLGIPFKAKIQAQFQVPQGTFSGPVLEHLVNKAL